MNRAFFEAVTGPHGALLLGALDERSLRSLNGHFPTFHHDGQLPPPLTGEGSEWRTWLIMAGRGFGKTRAGAEWVLSLVRGEVLQAPTLQGRGGAAQRRRGGACQDSTASPDTPHPNPSPDGEGLRNLRIALVAATIDEARSVMIEGPSGLLALARHKEIAEWSPSRHRLRFANGAEVILYSGAHGEGLRGPEHHYAWCDELAKWPQAESAWDNLQLGLRVGDRPRALVTTTPKVSALLQRIRDAPDTVLTGGATQANPHLPSAFVSAMERQYAGTRLGRQELDGVMLTDVAGSLWPQALIARCRATAFQIPFVSSLVETPFRGGLPHGVSTSLDTNGNYNLTRIVIGVDPPASANGTCGIVVCGRDAGDVAYVIADCSVSGASPETWARAVVDAAERFGADRVVAESNQGGDMVRSVLLAASATLPVELAHAGQGKSARAEPVAALFENGRAFFAGHFAELEEQLSGLVAGGGYGGPSTGSGARSPDRADACVWALWALMLKPKVVPPRIRVL